ncbi:hypothetical protein [Sphingomonas sp.]|uniref:hypothetical protein n=1 Tax=Sphingomonas sp. TaxID=28214 RepID=UPI003CC5A16D
MSSVLWLGRSAVIAAAFAVPGAAVRAADGPVQAGSSDCSALLTAARALGAAPQFHSVMVAKAPNRRRPMEREEVVIGQTLYATSPAGGRWMKLPINATGREELAAALSRYPPHDCVVTDSTLDGVPVRLHTYRQDVSGPGSAATRLWAGEDGLPRRIESQEGAVQIVITVRYDDVTAPSFH